MVTSCERWFEHPSIMPMDSRKSLSTEGSGVKMFESQGAEIFGLRLELVRQSMHDCARVVSGIDAV